MTEREAIEILGRPFSMQEAPKEILDAHRLAISALEKQEKDRWVPVTERPPEKDCQCRVTEGDFKSVIDCNWNNHKKQFEAWSYYDDGYIPITNVTAWKPIEEPYEGRRDGNK